MTEWDDIALLKQFAENDSESAFAELVSRHLNLVYSVALRNVGNAHAAQEIVQAVFIILARKAKSLGAKTILSGWLYQTARLTAANYLRTEIRRQQREQEAFMESALNETANETWLQIAPVLDDAMAKLGGRDHDAIVLRFFENKSLSEVGAVIGASEDAAKMRVNRALEKLRKIFMKRGVSSTTAIIAGAISANSVHAAPTLLAKTTTAVALAKGATASVSTLTLIKGALKIMTWTKAKIAIVAGVGLLLAPGIATVAVIEIENHNDVQWDIGRADWNILQKAPLIVKIVASRFPDQEGSNVEGGNGQVLGIAETADQIVEKAFGKSDGLRTSFLTQLPRGKFDYIANLPAGSQAAFRQAVQKKFGIIARLETQDTDVLYLKIKSTAASGITLVTTNRNSLSGVVGPGEFHMENGSIGGLANFLERQLGIPVFDQTGLTGNYDVNLKWDYRNDRDHENLKRALSEQLGLKLVEGTEPVEKLVVKKAK